MWSCRPICPASLLPPQLFWSKLGIQTPPPIEHVLEHLRSIPSDTLERWSFPESRESAFQRVFEYLADRVDRLPQQQLQLLQDTACVPVSNQMVRPSRLFFHLSEQLAPFLFEVPREFGAYDELFRTLGVRDKTDHAQCLVELLAELREEFNGAALNASEIRTTIQILHHLSDSFSESTHVYQSIMLPTSASTLEAASGLYHNDAHWIMSRVDVASLRFTHPLLPLHLAARFGVQQLSDAVVERLDVSLEPGEIVFADVDRWNALLQSSAFADGIVRCTVHHHGVSSTELDGMALDAESIATTLSRYSVRVVQNIPTRFFLLPRKNLVEIFGDMADRASEVGITLTSSSGRSSGGSQFFVEPKTHTIYLAQWAEYVRPEDILA